MLTLRTVLMVGGWAPELTVMAMGEADAVALAESVMARVAEYVPATV